MLPLVGRLVRRRREVAKAARENASRAAAAREAAERARAEREARMRRDMLVCFRCSRLRGETAYGRQNCGCEPPSTADFGDAIKEWFQLCTVCAAGTAGGPMRFAWLGCRNCVDLEKHLRRTTARVVIPLGRHSLMNGVGLEGRVAATRPDAVDDFARDLDALTGGWESLRGWKIGQVTRLAVDVGFAPARDEVTIGEWFARVHGSPAWSRECYERYLGITLPDE